MAVSEISRWSDGGGGGWGNGCGSGSGGDHASGDGDAWGCGGDIFVNICFDGDDGEFGDGFGDGGCDEDGNCEVEEYSDDYDGD